MLASKTAQPGNNLSSQKMLTESKKARRLFLQSNNLSVSEQHIATFFNDACIKSGIAIMPGDPIIASWIAPEGKYGFIEFRSLDEASAGLALNGITFQGLPMTVKRPNDYEPAPDWIPTNISLNAPGQFVSAAPAAAPVMGSLFTATAQPALDMAQLAAGTAGGGGGAPTVVLVLHNMMSEADLNDETEYAGILSDAKEECEKFGSVVEVKCPKEGPGRAKIYVHFEAVEAAVQARDVLHGRMFDHQTVLASYMDKDDFLNEKF